MKWGKETKYLFTLEAIWISNFGRIKSDKILIIVITIIIAVAKIKVDWNVTNAKENTETYGITVKHIEKVLLLI